MKDMTKDVKEMGIMTWRREAQNRKEWAGGRGRGRERERERDSFYKS